MRAFLISLVIIAPLFACSGEEHVSDYESSTTSRDTSAEVSSADGGSASLPGWGKFRFGMSRGEVLAAGGPSHKTTGENEIAYPVEVEGRPYTATAIPQNEYLKSIVLDDDSAISATSKEDCFSLARDNAARLSATYGEGENRGEQSLAGIEMVNYVWDFQDGNRVTANGMFSDGCRAGIIYDGPTKRDSANF